MNAVPQRSSRRVCTWRRIGAFTDHFALYAGEQQLAVLKIGGLADHVAQLAAGDTRLVFLSDGLGGRHIQVRDADTSAAVARYERNWRGSGGILRLAEGGQLRWARAGGFWAPDRMFVNIDGTALVRFAADGTVANLMADEPPAVASRDLLVVLALGWLLMLSARGEVG